MFWTTVLLKVERGTENNFGLLRRHAMEKRKEMDSMTPKQPDGLDLQYLFSHVKTYKKLDRRNRKLVANAAGLLILKLNLKDRLNEIAKLFIQFVRGLGFKPRDLDICKVIFEKIRRERKTRAKNKKISNS